MFVENNIYGVDINEESVEITKLSLFLKIASKNRKLIGIEQNIKVGNSLVNDKQIDNKAFCWDDEFPEVMKFGKFDIVIGNPPYVTTRKISKTYRDHLWEKYRSFLKDEINTFTLFYARLGDLIKNNGYWGFITPSGWYTNNPYIKLREWFFKKNKIIEIVDFPYRFFPFDDVNTETAIVLGRKSYEKNNVVRILLGEKDFLKNTHDIRPSLQVNTIKQDEIITNPSYRFYIYQTKITTKLNKIEEKLNKIIKVHNPSSLDRKYRYPRTAKQYDKCVFSEKEINNDNDLKMISSPCLEGEDIQRYYYIDNKKFTNLKWLDESGNEKSLNSKTLSWMNQMKIVGQRITGQVSRRLIFSTDFTKKITMPSVNIILLKNYTLNNDEKKNMLQYVLALLNSKLFHYYYKKKFGEANTNITSDVLEDFPFKLLDNKELLIQKVAFMLKLNNDFQENLQKLLTRIRDNLNIEKISQKLLMIYDIDFNQFLQELEKNNVKLSLKEQDEWQDYFEKYKKDFAQLHSQIKKTDSEIDSMVYELFELTNDEIEMIEKEYG